MHSYNRPQVQHIECIVDASRLRITASSFGQFRTQDIELLKGNGFCCFWSTQVLELELVLGCVRVGGPEPGPELFDCGDFSIYEMLSLDDDTAAGKSSMIQERVENICVERKSIVDVNRLCIGPDVCKPKVLQPTCHSLVMRP